MSKKAEGSKFKPRIAKYWDDLDGPPQMEYYYSGDSYLKVGYYPEDEFIIAASNGNLKMCQEFIEQGIDVNIVRYKTKETALHVAARSCHPELCKLLLEHGAKVNLRSPDNETPLMVATETASGRKAGEGLKNALQTCEILIQHGADVNIIGGPSGKLTLKYYATARGDNPALTELLEKHELLHQGRFVEEKSSIDLAHKYSDSEIDVQINGEDSGNNDWWCTIL
jgi:hypothetical protein